MKLPRNKIEVHISRDNLNVFKDALRSLSENRESLFKMLDAYPVICSFGHMQALLAEPSDVEDLIAELRKKLQAVESPSKGRTGDQGGAIVTARV